MKPAWTIAAFSGLIAAASARPAARSTLTWSQLRENVSNLSVLYDIFPQVRAMIKATDL